jgi:simple sugar transport system ATP-binding protein
VFELCDDLTILRDGEVVAAGAAKDFTEVDLIEKMSAARASGEDPPERRLRDPKPASRTGDGVILRARGLRIGERVRSVDLSLREGEWVGLTGLVGSGAVALASSFAGFGAFDDGTVVVGGKRLPPGRADVAVDLGIGFVPPDRHGNGVVDTLSVGRNITLPSLRRLSRFGFVRERAERRTALAEVERMGIVAGSIDDLVTSLSGGNQQKVLLGRAFAGDPDVLVLANPTVGVDIASKRVIYEWMRRARDEGKSGIVASEDELSDLEICDRVLVITAGRVACELGPDRTSAELLGAIEGYARPTEGTPA